MAKDKNFRKSLKGPDKFQQQVAGSLGVVYSNRAQIGAALSVAVLLILGFFGYQYWQSQASEQRRQELAEIEKVFSKEQESTDKKMEKINNEISALKAAAADKSPASTDTQTKINELESSLAKVKPDHTDSTARFVAYGQKYPERPEGWYAALKAAALLLDQKKLQEGKDILINLVQKTPQEDFYQIQGRLLLMGVLEEQKDLNSALEQANKLEAAVSKELKPRVLLAKGRLLLGLNKKDDAQKTFDLIIKDFATSNEAKVAQGLKILLLN